MVTARSNGHRTETQNLPLKNRCLKEAHGRGQNELHGPVLGFVATTAPARAPHSTYQNERLRGRESGAFIKGDRKKQAVARSAASLPSCLVGHLTYCRAFGPATGSSARPKHHSSAWPQTQLQGIRLPEVKSRNELSLRSAPDERMPWNRKSIASGWFNGDNGQSYCRDCEI